MIELLSSPEAWVSLGVLTLMEVVLGIDNIVFITILAARLPEHQQKLGRQLGLAGALVTRVLLLLGINWLIHLEEGLFDAMGRAWSGKDLVLIAGGLFLLWKATREIYSSVEHPEDHEGGTASGKAAATLASVVTQVMLLDIVFSLDSVITAVGMADHVEVMVAAILLAVIVMMVFAGPVGDFVTENPSVRILALAFLVLIGATLIMEGTGTHVEKGYVYSAMGFSLLVQILNLRMDRRRTPDSDASAA
ncbi:MAG: TerC family protein [Myxococcales bacterium]|nr:TerC family protein [Myxococcales bacterium]